MGYNENWHNDISGVDVVEKGGKDIKGGQEKNIKDLAISYLNRGDIRKLPSDDFNKLVARIEDYLKHIDSDKNLIDRKFEELKKQTIDESKIKLRSNDKLKPNELKLNEIKSLAGLSHYIDQSSDETMKTLEKEIGIDNIWKIIFLTGVYTSAEIGKGLFDSLKIGEGTAQGLEALDRNDIGNIRKLFELTKGVGLDGLRALILLPGIKYLFKGLVMTLSKIKVPASLYEIAYNNHGSIVLKGGENLTEKGGDVYMQYPFLKKHKEFLGENLKMDAIIGEGTQAVIIKHPTDKSLIVKIAKEGQVDDIITEYDNHRKVFDNWQKGIINKDINPKIRIPYINKGTSDGYFIMEKIDGQSLYSKSLIDYFKMRVSPSELIKMENYTDMELRIFLKNKFKTNDSMLNMIVTDYSGDKLMDLLGTSYKYKLENGKIGGTNLSNALDYLNNNGIRHNDLHPGNIMIDKKGNIYIIDFGRIK